MNDLNFAIKMENDGEKYYREQAEINKNNALYTVCLKMAESSKELGDITIINYILEVYNGLERYYQDYGYYPWQEDGNSDTTILTEMDNTLWSKLITTNMVKSGLMKNFKSADKITIIKKGNKNYVCVKPQSKKGAIKAKSICQKNLDIRNTVLCTQEQEQTCVSDNLGYNDYRN